MKRNRKTLKPYFVEPFRLNKYFTKPLFKVYVEDPTMVTAVDVEMDKNYILRIQLLNSYGRKVSVADVALKSRIIHGGGIILDIDASQEEQFIDIIDYKPLIPPKVHSSLAENHKKETKIQKEKPSEPTINDHKKKRVFNMPKRSRGLITVLYKDGRPINPGSIINAKLYCLTNEIFLSADKGAMLSQYEISRLEDQIKDIKNSYDRLLHQTEDAHKTLVDTLIEENGKLKFEIDQLKLGKNSEDAVNRFTQLVQKRHNGKITSGENHD